MQLRHLSQLSEEDWKRYHALRLTLRERYNPASAEGAPVRTTEAFRSRILNSLKVLQAREFVLFSAQGQEALGWFRLMRQNDFISGQADFLADKIPPGFINLFLKGAAVEMSRHDLHKAVFFSEDYRFVDGLQGFRPDQAIPFHQLGLKVPDIDLRKMEQWGAGVESQGFRFEFVQGLPEDVIPDYIRLHNQFLADLPLGGFDSQMSNITQEVIAQFKQVSKLHKNELLALFLTDPNGRRVGFTELTIATETNKGAQGMTGLLQDFRGRGLAKALKGQMLLQARSMFPELKYISTTTNAHNLPMLAINQEVGFQITKQSHQILFERGNLEKTVGIKPAD